MMPKFDTGDRVINKTTGELLYIHAVCIGENSEVTYRCGRPYDKQVFKESDLVPLD